MNANATITDEEKKTVEEKTPISIFIKAIEQGDSDTVHSMLDDADFDPSVDGCKALKTAVMNGRIEIAEILLDDERIDPTSDNYYAFVKAIDLGHLAIVKLFIEHDKFYSPDAETMEDCIESAAESKDSEMVKYLLCYCDDAGIKINPIGAYRVAKCEDDDETIEHLTNWYKDNHMDPDDQDYDGEPEYDPEAIYCYNQSISERQWWFDWLIDY